MFALHVHERAGAQAGSGVQRVSGASNQGRSDAGMAFALEGSDPITLRCRVRHAEVFWNLRESTGATGQEEQVWRSGAPGTVLREYPGPAEREQLWCQGLAGVWRDHHLAGGAA